MGGSVKLPATGVAGFGRSKIRCYVGGLISPRSLPVYPRVALDGLDTLWFQVAGTICNLTCRHCFTSCSPTNRAHDMLSLATVTRALAEAEQLGVREYVFTGGEPFMNDAIVPMLRGALAQGPVSVLTNGVLLDAALARVLRDLSDAASYSLEIRISIDGWNAEGNDAIRGAGSFERALRGVRETALAGIDPILRVTEACDVAASREGRARLLELLRASGIARPRLEIVPLFRIGAEATRLRGYEPWESLADRTLLPAETERLACSSGRVITSRGVFVCPYLIDASDARLGDSLAESLVPFDLRHRACFTCQAVGASCRT